jgi:hypothetical protein
VHTKMLLKHKRAEAERKPSLAHQETRAYN